MLSFGSGTDFAGTPLIGAWSLGVGFLMASTLPTFQSNDLRFLSALVMLPTLLVVGLTMASMISDPWLTLHRRRYLSYSICFRFGVIIACKNGRTNRRRGETNPSADAQIIPTKARLRVSYIRPVSPSDRRSSA